MAAKWTKSSSNMLANFLNNYPDLPIVVYGKNHDYKKVLVPAFERVDNLKKLPKTERWRCALDLASRLPQLYTFSLDNVLEHCGFESRDEEEPHNAI